MFDGDGSGLALTSILAGSHDVPLVDVEISIASTDLPADVASFLREADSRVSRFVQDHPARVAGFVPSDFATVYRGLRAITDANLACGSSLCEWGSGLGVVSSLAAMLQFDVCGIEIDEGLVAASRTLADDFALPVEFVHGSFIPSGGEADAEEAYAENDGKFFWIVTDSDDAYGELGLDPDDFDVVFAYPWPGEENLITTLFEKYAAEEALLLLYGELDSLRLVRKVGKGYKGF
ncbi:MAG: hypothetical protein VB875_03320 [Pirellulales bacterium]